MARPALVVVAADMTAIIREERIGGQRLILGDCLGVMKELGRFDAIVTDPPYGIGAKMKGGTWAAKAAFGGFQKWDMETPDWLVEAIGDTPAIVWGGNYLPFAPTRCWLIWNKVNAVPTMADFEQAWTNLDRPSKRFDHPVGRVEYGHPTQKPLSLMEWCLGFVPNAKTILDPFLGSGTTLVACQRLGRMGTGVEIDPEYWTIACERVHKAWQQADLFIQSPNATEPQQERLFDV